jgi:hypothetical protein
MELVNGDVTFEPSDPRIDPLALGSLCSKLLEEAECSICLGKLHDALGMLDYCVSPHVIMFFTMFVWMN